MRRFRSFNGRREAKEIRQPAPVFFTPEQRQKMTVGYQFRPERSVASATDEAILAMKEAEKTLAELNRTKERMKIVLASRESELANTKAQLMECVKEMCRMCGDDRYPENGTCRNCKWKAVKEIENDG